MNGNKKKHLKPIENLIIRHFIIVFTSAAFAVINLIKKHN